MPDKVQYLLTVQCPDRGGIVAAVTTFLHEHGFSIREAHQHESAADCLFFMRIAFAGLSEDVPDLPTLQAKFRLIAAEFAMEAAFRDLAVKPRALIMVSRFGHCLYDILHRWRAGQLPIEVPAVVSNHADMRSFVEWCGAPFHHLPVTSATRTEQEERLIELLQELRVDLVVLARYMQILSPRLCEALAGRCINIHHSFLPGFKGARPYHQAHARGVKIIGATAHYVTTDLDEGPIIEQETRRVSHARAPEELISIGQELESSVLTRALRWHVEGRIFTKGNRTIIFD